LRATASPIATVGQTRWTALTVVVTMMSFSVLTSLRLRPAM
jgi:hypothetical protein